MADPAAAPAPAADPLAGRRVLVGVTGGIAAYKAAILVRLLQGAGAEVDVVLTRGATRFVGAATFEGLTGRAVRQEVWEDIAAETHVALGRGADVVVVYPATAHTLAKLAAGLADDLLTTTLLAATCPLVLAPAMHTEMWEHPATRHNAAILRDRGASIVGPDDGLLMGGDTGPGRLIAPEVALAAVRGALASGAERSVGAEAPRAGDLLGTRVLVTAGGTREPVDPVRYLGNRSSGRMGFALAAAARDRGAEVTLVAGPTELATPEGVTRHDVTTALEMHAAVFEHLAAADVVIKAAAVADFRPGSPATSKLKKEHGVPRIELTPNPDILAELGAGRTGDHPLLVGFAAETDEVEAGGWAKLERKGADLLVVNDVAADDAGFEVEHNRVVILDRAGGRVEVPLADKRTVAERVLDRVVAWRAAAGTDTTAATPASRGAGTVAAPVGTVTDAR
ncbi:MAG: bifunctional phosphopantothenoylcysteine decarboxylase/phosphopantothenate--cysteine ligase CoaBC [Nitriliruptor sp.]|nr:MAG: bifunctional phosphopantothenoylcysteine decarboxylase/phosphopantothenate--cysteine ligase CoaBC [Nitriliruptor sp.]